MTHRTSAPLTAVLIALVLAHAAAPAGAQTLSAASSDAAWTLVKDLPLATRLTLVTADQEFDATLAAVRADELVVTDPTFQRTHMRQADGVPNGFIVPRADLTGTRVKQLGRRYKMAAGDAPNVVTVRHVVSTLGTRRPIEIRTAQPKAVVGRIAAAGDASVTIRKGKTLVEVPFADVRSVRTAPALSRSDLITLGVVAGVLAAVSMAIAARV